MLAARGEHLFRSASIAGAWCRVKAVISALDGVLAAEEEAKISAGLEMPGRALLDSQGSSLQSKSHFLQARSSFC